MPVIKCLHAAILTANLEQADQFYSQILGLETAERPLNFPGIWYQVGEFQIHLMQTSTLVRDLVNPEKWGRNRHLAFAVTDLEQLKQQLTARHYPFQLSSSGRVAVFVQDPDGNMIELSQV
ncbi:MAG: glyoxalase [Oscillatoriales cyanobacterium RM1_1_9]|nr:glyoxalase [Oscillatoriales cyanobacterium SM2_3_0]NJO46971.1 glyoxalase [Oscillatoriales cyanobacterium RM2_1_1]NJO71710.1 glyoxalase [Oscillatoriales cyanobacterium RM1_1_9]